MHSLHLLKLFEILITCFVVHTLTQTPIIPRTTVVTIVDLSHELNEDVPRNPIFKPLTRNLSIFGDEQVDGFSFDFEDFCLSFHLGTHMDAPCHRNTTSWCIADIPLERLVLVPAAVIDITKKVFANETVIKAETQLTIEDITDWEKENGRIPDNSVVFIFTGWSRYWGNSELFLGSGDDASDYTKHHHPGLSPKAAQWLTRERPSIYGVGIDTMSVDYGRSRKFLSQKHLAAANMFNVDNLANLDKLPATGALINIGAIKIGRSASGVPVRVVATLYSTKE